MAKDNSIKKVLLIGSGPITIGQAAEFDFSGSQACRSLKEEGIEVVLVNSNPATIMTDSDMADAVYIEPLNARMIEKIIEKEKPDSIIAGMGGQTALNLTTELADMGILEKNNVRIIGTSVEAIKNTEDRELFKEFMLKIGEKVPRSIAISSVDELNKAVDEFGFPLIVRPAYTLGGAGGGIAHTYEELLEISSHGLKKSRIHQVLIEESVLGWSEIEYEVMRDKNDTCIVICTMENIDPMGVHTGESMVVAPILTLSEENKKMLHEASVKIIRALNIEGGCNIQYAFKDGDYRIVEVNPRVSRSSALASKATGFPIARYTAKIAIGKTLDEMIKGIEPGSSSYTPDIRYIVSKIPRWPFDKFKSADRTLTTAMKSTGEVMAIGQSVEESVLKSVRSLDIDVLWDSFVLSNEETVRLLKVPTDLRLFTIFHALRAGFSVNEIADLTRMKPFFIEKFKNITDMQNRLKNEKLTDSLLKDAKILGFTDAEISRISNCSEIEIAEMRRKSGIVPKYMSVDSCSGDLYSYTPYFYSTYGEKPNAECDLGFKSKESAQKKKKVLILGSGPIRIGQGIEFDYCTVHAVTALKEIGIETHIINNNPETVSTDFDTSDKLFFEPLTLEDVMNVIEHEKPDGVLVQFGGQTSVNLAIPLKEECTRRNLPTEIFGTTPEDMDLAEDREKFNILMNKLGILQPDAGYATSEAEAVEVAEKIGYPVLVRPSYVLGGRAMEIVSNRDELEQYMIAAVRVSPDHPILIDDFLDGAREIDVDAVSDGKTVLIGAIMEHVEQAGVHSGDSACVIPPQNLSDDVLNTVRKYTKDVALALNVKGIINIQMAEKNGDVYILEANPRSSRTVPFVSKATGIPLAKIAARVMAGESLKEMGYDFEKEPEIDHIAVKEVLLPFDKLSCGDPLLSPEMKSTGEVMGIDYDFGLAYYKAEMAAENKLPVEGTVFMSIRDADKEEMLDVARRMSACGLKLIGTTGTAEFMENNGVSMNVVHKIHEGTPSILDRLRKNEVHLVINTPTLKPKARHDGSKIRRSAVDNGVPYITTLQGAKAAAIAIESAIEKEMTIKSIQEYIGKS
ncbi:MAG: carbamoyl-phosphate synthase large subunit [Methanosarcinaceae archaeon]|nr:carbamoyl-phosphate synthase large subunit [Methanosarcinaceae archaeon]